MIILEVTSPGRVMHPGLFHLPHPSKAHFWV
jgi:hypothetical protein